MVERPQQQDRVNGPVRQIQPSSVHDSSVYAASVRCTAAQLVDVQRDEITKVNPIAQVCKPQRVPPRATTNVGDYCRGRRQMLRQQFRRPLELNYSERAVKPIDLMTQVVIALASLAARSITVVILLLSGQCAPSVTARYGQSAEWRSRTRLGGSWRFGAPARAPEVSPALAWTTGETCTQATLRECWEDCRDERAVRGGPQGHTLDMDAVLDATRTGWWPHPAGLASGLESA